MAEDITTWQVDEAQIRTRLGSTLKREDVELPSEAELRRLAAAADAHKFTATADADQ